MHHVFKLSEQLIVFSILYCILLNNSRISFAVKLNRFPFQFLSNLMKTKGLMLVQMRHYLKEKKEKRILYLLFARQKI